MRVGALFAGSMLAVSLVAGAQDRFERKLPEKIKKLKLASPLQSNAQGILDESLVGAEGEQQVIVRLRTGSVASINKVPLAELNYDRHGARHARKNKIEAEQQDFLDRCLRAAPGARVLAQTKLVLNAVFLEVDAAALPAIAQDPAVMHIRPVANYEMDLSETVPYIGATDVQNMGFDGSGIRVAILDSGIDYNHANLGGSGDPADYADNDPTFIELDTFPTAKVVGGHDFVGSAWPAGPLAPDPDPLDDGPGAFHGTHVADIAGGAGGVAPGVDLYAVKVCSSTSSACSGVALINGMEFAVDPNGDGDPEDHVDIINMSLGAPYGQPFDDDLSTAVDNATAIGVLSVVSAGNSSDKPFVVGSPSAAVTALSVAQTQVPSALQVEMEIVSPSSIADSYEAVFQPWSAPLAGIISGPVQYGDGAGGGENGCSVGPDPNLGPSPFPPSSLTGKIVLVDRGLCNFSTKIQNIEAGGGILGIIGLVAPGDPFPGGFGGGPLPTIPGYMISEADADTIRSGLTTGVVVARFDPAAGTPLIMTMVGSSSRGPQYQDFRIKPEIGAPGASISAEVGTGTGVTPFGGTSGAAPMVTGSAALLMQAFPEISPAEVKARLMNNGETDILNEGGGLLAPISRIGGGEVRVDLAFMAPAAAWDDKDKSHPGALSFGYHEVDKKKKKLQRTVKVRNYSDEDIEYTITPTFRFDDDADSGAVSITAPSSVKVKAGKDKKFKVKMEIDGTLLDGNHMNSGSGGANGSMLTLNEFDGYIILDDGSHPIHLPWHVIPRKAAKMKVKPKDLKFGDGVTVEIELQNKGVGTAQNDAFSLLATSKNLKEGDRGEQSPTPDIRAVGVQTFPVPAGFCSAEDSFVWAFAVNTWERQTHADVPGIYWFNLDTDQDGTPDYAVFSYDFAGLGSISDGRNVTWAAPWVDFPNFIGDQSAFFFTEHATNSANTVLYICGEQVGLTGTDMLNTNVDITVEAIDIYFGGPGDQVGDMTITPLGERYFGITSDVPAFSNGSMTVLDFGPLPGNTPELGLMMFTNGDRGPGNRGGATRKTEALILKAKHKHKHKK